MPKRTKAAAPMAISIPVAEPVADKYKADADALAKELHVAPIAVTTDEQAAAVSEMIAELGEQKAELTRLMKSITDPINKGLKQARALFQPAIKAIEVPDRMLRKALGDYRVRQHEATLAARDEAAAAAERGDTDALHAALATVEPATSDASTGTRFRWIVARIDESKMPREWLTADIARLNALCRATSGQDDIEGVPGVTFEREAIVVRK